MSWPQLCSVLRLEQYRYHEPGLISTEQVLGDKPQHGSGGLTLDQYLLEHHFTEKLFERASESTWAFQLHTHTQILGS